MKHTIIIYLFLLFSNIIYADDILDIKTKFNDLYGSINTFSAEMIIETIDSYDKTADRVFCLYHFKAPNLFYKSLKNEHSENITISNGEKIRVIFPEIDFYDDFIISELDEETLENIYKQNLIVNYIDFNYLYEKFNLLKITENENSYKLFLAADEEIDIKDIELTLNKINLLPEEIIVVFENIGGLSSSKITFIEIKVNPIISTEIFYFND